MSDKNEFHIREAPKELVQSQAPIALETLEEYPYKSVALGSTHANLTGLWRYWRPYFQTKRAPCDATCPVGNQVVDYIQTLLEGHSTQAANILRSENPLPAITGRICHRPCEVSCNRRQYDKRIAIHDIEAVLAEVQYETLRFPANEQPLNVAVVGSGPAELAFAHFMALVRHRVTLFEGAKALGGRLRDGRQARHLPDGILDAEIRRIVAGRIEVRHSAGKLEDLKPEFDVIFGVPDAPEHLALYISASDDQVHNQNASFLDPLLGDGDPKDSVIKIPLRVSEAIGYGKWVALLLDSDRRGLDPSDTLARIQVGGNTRIVSALKYMALLTEHDVKRSEEVVSYEKLNLDMLDPPRPVEPAMAAQAHQFVTTDFVTVDDVQRVLLESARCFSCGRCNDCDNCWIYCPDAVISRDEGRYEIDYDYCKGCSVCAAVCPRGVFSIIEEEEWQRHSG